jgi:hypothetical protein
LPATTISHATSCERLMAPSGCRLTCSDPRW